MNRILKSLTLAICLIILSSALQATPPSDEEGNAQLFKTPQRPTLSSYDSCNTSRISTLPPEIFAVIIDFLDNKDLSQLSLVCKPFYFYGKYQDKLRNQANDFYTQNQEFLRGLTPNFNAGISYFAASKLKNFQARRPL